MDFLALFNAVAEVARPVHVKYNPLPDKVCSVVEYGLDSLDLLMISVYLCELHGIPEEVGKEMHAETVQEFEDFINAHKTQVPESIEAAVEYCK